MTWNIYFLNEKWYCDVYTFYFYKVLIDSENILQIIILISTNKNRMCYLHFNLFGEGGYSRYFLGNDHQIP